MTIKTIHAGMKSNAKCMCVFMCACICNGVALTGLLVFSGLQASGWSEGFSSASSWTTEEAATRTSHTRQATHLCSLYQLLQVSGAA